MSVQNFIPELWNAAILEPYKKNLIFGQDGIASTSYYGQITGMGDTVTINTLNDLTIKDYTKGQDIEIENLETTPTKVKIDQGKYFAFGVDDVDKIQAAGELQGVATRRAGIQLRDAADQYLSKVLAEGAHKDNKVGAMNVIKEDPHRVTTGDTAYDALVALSERLDDQSVPTEDRWVVIGSKTRSALLNDPRFVNVDKSGTSEGLRNGVIGRVIGFDVMVSNNIQKKGGTGKTPVTETLVAGVPDAFAFASQILKTEALRDQNQFRDIVRGLHVYGASVVRPEGIATVDVTVGAAGAGAGAAA